MNWLTEINKYEREVLSNRSDVSAPANGSPNDKAHSGLMGPNSHTKKASQIDPIKN
jgi:hypothetical protein